jgi:predicted PurR-regulated permease PerM
MPARAVEPQEVQPVRVASSQPPLSPTAMLVMIAAVVAGLYLGRDVFIPLALAILLSFALSPIVTRLRRVGLGRAPSVLLVVVLALGFVSGFAWLLVNQAINLAEDLPRYEYNLRQKMRIFSNQSAGTGVLEQTADLLRRMGDEIDKKDATGGTSGPAATTTGSGEPRPVQPIPVEVHEQPETPLQAAREVLELVAAPLATVGIMLLFVIFVLLQREDLRDRFIRLFGSADVHRTTDAMSDAASRIGRYLLMQLLINLLYGTLFGAGLYLIGVPNPLLWGMVGVVLRFIPFIGAPLSVLFPLVVSLAADVGWTMPLEVIGLFVAIEALLTYGIEPYLYGSSTGLSPAALVVATAFWTVLWGPVGLLLATPLTACLVVIGRHVPQLEFLEVLLGNRAVLSPPLRFYQRLLASDPREAEEVVEEEMRESGLLPAFEQVVVPALGLIEADRQRGAIGRERQREIADDIIEIVEDVADENAPARDRAAPVLCLGARSGLDHAGACLLAATLCAEGYDASLITPGEMAGQRLDDLPRDGVRLVCLSRGSSAGLAQARRVARRLRARIGPEVPIVLTLWNADPEKSEPENLALSSGVTRVALTLTQAVEAARAILGEPVAQMPAEPASAPPLELRPTIAPAPG